MMRVRTTIQLPPSNNKCIDLFFITARRRRTREKAEENTKRNESSGQVHLFFVYGEVDGVEINMAPNGRITSMQIGVESVCVCVERKPIFLLRSTVYAHNRPYDTDTILFSLHARRLAEMNSCVPLCHTHDQLKNQKRTHTQYENDNVRNNFPHIYSRMRFFSHCSECNDEVKLDVQLNNQTLNIHLWSLCVCVCVCFTYSFWCLIWRRQDRAYHHRVLVPLLLLLLVTSRLCCSSCTQSVAFKLSLLLLLLLPFTKYKFYQSSQFPAAN